MLKIIVKGSLSDPPYGVNIFKCCCASGSGRAYSARKCSKLKTFSQRLLLNKHVDTTGIEAVACTNTIDIVIVEERWLGDQSVSIPKTTTFTPIFHNNNITCS